MRTIVCKLIAQPDATVALDATLKVFAAACNFVAAWGRENKVVAQFALQKGCYRDIRSTFGLSANLAVRAIARVAPRLAKAKTRNAVFRPTSVDYDARIFSFHEKDWLVGLTLIGGRRKFALSIGQFQRDALAGKKPTSAVLSKRDSQYFIGIIVEDGDVPQKTGPVLGVDVGITNTAALSTGKLFSGAARQAFKKQRAKIRAALQSKGTRGAKRLLKRLSGYERRRIAWENHNLSKAIVAEAVRGGFGLIAMERLKHIRQKTKAWNKHINRAISGWSFGQLQSFTEYKAACAGLPTKYRNPAYTSQTCALCGERGERRGEVFRCFTHGERHADWNAAQNIAGGAAVIPPEQPIDLVLIGHVAQVESPEFTLG